jgi:hypothetical protein
LCCFSISRKSFENPPERRAVFFLIVGERLEQPHEGDAAFVGDPVAHDFVHVVELAPGVATLAPAAQTILEKLLTYGPRRQARPPVGLLQVVAPRPGTISPWSSKATDIAHICGLTQVKRIERVVAYTVEFGSAAAPPLHVCRPTARHARREAPRPHDPGRPSGARRLRHPFPVMSRRAR